jgi:hypothetical protein
MAQRGQLGDGVHWHWLLPGEQKKSEKKTFGTAVECQPTECQLAECQLTECQFF